MKRKTTLLKLIFACMLTVASLKSSAQISNTDITALKVTGGTTAAIFCMENASFKLTASAADADGNAFTSYKWTEISTAGGGASIDGVSEADSEKAEVEITPTTSGYHTYSVRGFIDNDNGSICQSDEEEIFTVFVLPELTAKAAVADNKTNLTYCLADVPDGGDAIVLNATSEFKSPMPAAPGLPASLTNPTVEQFTKNYQWYKVNTTGTVVRTPVGTNSETYTIVDAIEGTFKYEVDISYDLKGCGVYTGVATTNNGAVDPAIITVTPKPGKPTITIGAITP